MSAVLAAALTLTLAPQVQGPERVFEVHRQDDGPVLVSADRRAMRCLDALYALGDVMSWNVLVESRPLADQLAGASVDLYFDPQDPRLTGQLIAAAGGADVVFDPSRPDRPGRPTLHVIRPPDPSTEPGRQRLRNLAAQWYRSFLQDELQYEPLVEQEAMQVRMHLGHLLLESDDLESALAFFNEVWESRPNDAVTTAVLRIAECHIELSRPEKAEEWVRWILQSHPSQLPPAPAVVVLGRALLGLQRYDQCRAELDAYLRRGLEGREVIEVLLLIGEAEHRLGWPEKVRETMAALRDSRWFEAMSEDEYLDYHYLLGYGALGSGDPALAIRALEWYQVHAGVDPRRGSAFVMLSEAYLERGRFLEARAAAEEVRARHMGSLDEDGRREALKVYARAALALGEEEAAFQELEKLVLREEDPQLTLFLVDRLVEDRQWQRAIAIARPLAMRKGVHGDEARMRTVQVLFEQAEAAGNMEGFPPHAIDLALRMEDPELRSRCAELIGEAYTRLGKMEHAADAFRGILR